MAYKNPPETVSQGDVFSLYFPLLNPDGTPATYIAPVAWFSLAFTPYAVEGAMPALSKNSSIEGGVRIFQVLINSINTWVSYVDFSAADTDGLSPGGHYYELLIVDGGAQSTVATGAVNINPTITRP
jgi:hypothetical protein